MTPFCAAVVKILKQAPNGSLDADTLRHKLIDAGLGKHPAGVAMNLTKLAFKGEYVTQYCDRAGYRVFVLMAEGTVRRAAWHRPTDGYQVQQADGTLMATQRCAWDDKQDIWIATGAEYFPGYWKIGPKRSPPANARDTKRRIV